MTEGGTLLERATVVDLHCDTPMRFGAGGFDLGVRHDYGQVDIPRMREGGVTALFFSIYTSASVRPEVESVKVGFEIIDAVYEEVARHPEELVMASSAAEIEAAKKAGKIAICMGVEGGHMLDSSLGVLRNHYRLGARYMTLTHSRDTPWAGSSGEKTGKGLSDLGKEIVREMNRLGTMVDISHVNDPTFFDVMKVSKAPVIASHSSCRALASHPRNMTDEMIQALAERDGVIHINFYNSFLDDDVRSRANELTDLDERERVIRKQFEGDPAGLDEAQREIDAQRVERAGRVSFEKLLDHFQHVVELVGADHVGLGSDFDGVSDQLPEKMTSAADFPNLIDGLQGRGLSEEDVLKVLGGNTLRVMKAVEAAAG